MTSFMYCKYETFLDFPHGPALYCGSKPPGTINLVYHNLLCVRVTLMRLGRLISKQEVDDGGKKGLKLYSLKPQNTSKPAASLLSFFFLFNLSLCVGEQPWMFTKAIHPSDVYTASPQQASRPVWTCRLIHLSCRNISAVIIHQTKIGLADEIAF